MDANAAFSWATLTASVSAVPAVTLVMRRVLRGAPTENVFGSLATACDPMATVLFVLACA